MARLPLPSDRYLSVSDIVAVWQTQTTPGDASYFPAAEICLAESGGVTDAISPSGDYGLWQINRRVWFGSYGINDSNWRDPIVNAHAAWEISGHGANWAPWCTAWADPANNCGHGYLREPQPGSAAASEYARVAAGLANPRSGGPGLPPAAPGHSVDSAWGELVRYYGADAKRRHESLWSIIANSRRVPL